jgi:hypothetical protein
MIAAGSMFQRSDGRELALSSKPQPDGVLVKALARAWRWQKMLDRGVYGSVTEIAEAEKIFKSYVRCGNRAGPQPSLASGCPSR